VVGLPPRTAPAAGGSAGPGSSPPPSAPCRSGPGRSVGRQSPSPRRAARQSLATRWLEAPAGRAGPAACARAARRAAATSPPAAGTWPRAPAASRRAVACALAGPRGSRCAGPGGRARSPAAAAAPSAPGRAARARLRPSPADGPAPWQSPASPWSPERGHGAARGRGTGWGERLVVTVRMRTAAVRARTLLLFSARMRWTRVRPAAGLRSTSCSSSSAAAPEAASAFASSALAVLTERCRGRPHHRIRLVCPGLKYDASARARTLRLARASWRVPSPARAQPWRSLDPAFECRAESPRAWASVHAPRRRGAPVARPSTVSARCQQRDDPRRGSPRPCAGRRCSWTPAPRRRRLRRPCRRWPTAMGTGCAVPRRCPLRLRRPRSLAGWAIRSAARPPWRVSMAKRADPAVALGQRRLPSNLSSKLFMPAS